MSDPIRALRTEREHLVKRIADIDSAIGAYEQWIKDVARLLPDGDSTTLAPSPSVPTQVGPDTHEAKSGNADLELTHEVPQTPIRDFERIAREIFNEIDEPVQRAEMLVLLQERGVIVHGKDPSNTIGTRFARMGDVINLKPYGFWLSSRDFEPAGYEAPARVSSTLIDTL